MKDDIVEDAFPVGEVLVTGSRSGYVRMAQKPREDEARQRNKDKIFAEANC
jgi:hypothetical protein